MERLYRNNLQRLEARLATQRLLPGTDDRGNPRTHTTVGPTLWAQERGPLYPEAESATQLSSTSTSIATIAPAPTIVPVAVGLDAWPEGVWTFLYDELLVHYRLQEEHKIEPLRSLRAMLPDWRLCFDHTGGSATICPLEFDPQAPSINGDIDGVYGILHLLSPGDYARIVNLRNNHKPVEMAVRPCDPEAAPIWAIVFQSLPDRRTRRRMAAPMELRDDIAEAAAGWGLSPHYVKWLRDFPCIPSDLRGPEYWTDENSERHRFQLTRGPGVKLPPLRPQRRSPKRRPWERRMLLGHEVSRTR
eukprot:TRINITY_DN6882_c0_g1_i1.p1 TRINITY_DN6882_c0_g1~~TRINITY_DN6882_c0_g1_i1.p1  ORF type:complete len:303 (+),score=47.50 TRINITY_DN6882_c0_g1_i1:1-909(+)